MFSSDYVVGGSSLLRESLVEPKQNRPYVGVKIAQSLQQLDSESFCERLVSEFGKGGFRFRSRLAASANQAVSKRVRFFARRAGVYDSFAKPTEIFYKHNSERDHQRPQFANCQGLNALIGVHKAAEHFRIESAVGVSYESPGDSEYARKSFEVSRFQFRKLFIKASRKVIANFANLFVDNVEVVDEPLGCRSDCMFLLDFLGERAVALEEHSAILKYARREAASAPGIVGYFLSSCEALRVFFQSFNTEKFSAYRFLSAVKDAGERGDFHQRFGLASAIYAECSVSHATKQSRIVEQAARKISAREVRPARQSIALRLLSKRTSSVATPKTKKMWMYPFKVEGVMTPSSQKHKKKIEIVQSISAPLKPFKIQ